MPLTCTYDADQGLSFVLGPLWALSARTLRTLFSLNSLGRA